jgi:hypothetical protein
MIKERLLISKHALLSVKFPSFISSSIILLCIYLVDNDFRNGLFKLTAMLIHNIDKDENENELTFNAIGGAPNQINTKKGQLVRPIDY